MLKLYSFYWECGRQGNLEGLFIADTKDVETLIGKEIYFGEVLGKHSEIYGTLEEKDLSVESEDQEKIIWLQGLLSNSISGYNPFDYYNEDEQTV